MIDIWEDRISGRPAVIHGSATLYTAWVRRDHEWLHAGSYWTRDDAETAAKGLL